MRIDLEIGEILRQLVAAGEKDSHALDAATKKLTQLFTRHLDEELEHWDEEEQVDEFGRRLIAHEKCPHCGGGLAMWECELIFTEEGAA